MDKLTIARIRIKALTKEKKRINKELKRHQLTIKKHGDGGDFLVKMGAKLNRNI